MTSCNGGCRYMSRYITPPPRRICRMEGIDGVGPGLAIWRDLAGKGNVSVNLGSEHFLVSEAHPSIDWQVNSTSKRTDISNFQVFRTTKFFVCVFSTLTKIYYLKSLA
jgi:hypothetical protein